MGSLHSGPFWQKIPAYREIDEATFLDHQWQARNSVTTVEKLKLTLGQQVPDPFYRDVELGLRHVPMSVRISPYTLSLIDWQHPYEDPLCRQFLPLKSRQLPDHPKLRLDSLNELLDSPTPGLTHRYPDKVLFLALDKCPVYCRFCTRSYAVGLDTDDVEKLHLSANPERWSRAFDYIGTRPEIEDVVISGGDAFSLRPDQILEIGQALLRIPHLRRMRYATKGPAVMPMKLLTDNEWFRAFLQVVLEGRRQHKDVVLHTHFNHPVEITEITQRAMDRLFEEGVIMRNQSVLLRSVNDDIATMGQLLKRLGSLNIHPYYVYQHDMVKGVEDLRTTVQTALDLEKGLRGLTAGFNTPAFVVDAPGGGGKRDAHSFEHYNRTTGISVYRSPNIDPKRFYLYFDPIHLLPPEGQARWKEPSRRDLMVGEAIGAAKGSFNRK